MISIETGDLFQRDADAIVNATNTHNGGRSVPHGFMGAGIAKIFAAKYPEMESSYYDWCGPKGREPGRLHLWVNPSKNPKYVINFPTKREIFKPSRFEYIRDGLISLTTIIQETGIQSIAIPAIGCGLGNLKFDQVRDLVEDWANDEVPMVRVWLFAPR